jgi:hypothetical protein
MRWSIILLPLWLLCIMGKLKVDLRSVLLAAVTSNSMLEKGIARNTPRFM